MQLHLCLASKASCVKNRRKDKVSSNTERPSMPIEELLTISIGMGSNQSGLFESVRGKSVPLRISKVVSSNLKNFGGSCEEKSLVRSIQIVSTVLPGWNGSSQLAREQRVLYSREGGGGYFRNFWVGMCR